MYYRAITAAEDNTGAYTYITHSNDDDDYIHNKTTLYPFFPLSSLYSKPGKIKSFFVVMFICCVWSFLCVVMGLMGAQCERKKNETRGNPIPIALAISCMKKISPLDSLFTSVFFSLKENNCVANKILCGFL